MDSDLPTHSGNSVASQNIDEPTGESRRFSRLAGSLLWLLAGGFFLIAGRDIPRESFAGDSDPGPAWLPFVAASVLFFGGLLDAGWVIIRSRTRISRGDHRRHVDHLQQTSLPITRALRVARFFAPIAPALAVVVWAMVLPWIGFAVSCWCFIAIWLYASRAPWWQIILVSTLLVVLILMLFGQLFEVQLPRGVVWP